MNLERECADYLATLTHTDMATLVDLIAFNDADCPQEMPYYDQDVFLLSEQFPGYPNDPAYIAARTHARTAARSGIDSVINSGVDAIVAPHLTNSTGPAVAGYPNLSIPIGIRDNGRPAGMLMYSTFLYEPQLIGFGYALEQALNVRQQPQFLARSSRSRTADFARISLGNVGSQAQRVYRTAASGEIVGRSVLLEHGSKITILLPGIIFLCLPARSMVVRGAGASEFPRTPVWRLFIAFAALIGAVQSIAFRGS